MTAKLDNVFEGIAYKRLSATEVDPAVSRGHEFQGVRQFSQLLGIREREFAATFVYLSDEQDPKVQHGTVTWYDSRRGQPHRSSEWRLYYPQTLTLVQDSAREGDLIVVGLRLSGELAILVAESGSTWERQILWLFNLERNTPINRFQVGSMATLGARELDWAARTVLEALGIHPPVDVLVDPKDVHARFPEGFPPTRELSQFARDVAGPTSPLQDPDGALVRWVTVEEQIFRVLESRQWQTDKKLHDPCANLDSFLESSKSYQNRRKSRAGSSFENQLEYLFVAHNVRFRRQGRTEGKRKPDFLFPSEEAYHDGAFAKEKLAILGAKTSCKDRWRQVLSEGDRVQVKHLATLEPAISEAQTDEMRASQLRLVVPLEIASTYSESQRAWLMSLGQFIDHVKRL